MTAVLPVLIDADDCGGIIFSTLLLVAQAQRLNESLDVKDRQWIFFAVFIDRAS